MDQISQIRLPADDLAPYVRHARLGRDSGLLRTAYLGGATLFLGQLFPDTQDLTDVRLLQYLDMRPSDARAWYHARLLETLQAVRHDPDGSELDRVLRLERLYWEQADDRWMDERIEPVLDRASAYAAPGGHWLWNGKMKRYPSINWRSQHDVSVVRLLWVRGRPDMELKPDANLMRDTSVCTGRDWLNRCVNPNHYRLKTDLVPESFGDRLRGPGGRYVPDGEPKSTVAWSAAHTRVENGNLVVIHQHCGGDMGRAVQDAFRAGARRGVGYCPTCHRAQMEYRARFPRVSGALSTPARMQALENEIWLKAFSDGHLSGGPQQLPTEDEEPVQFDRWANGVDQSQV